MRWLEIARDVAVIAVALGLVAVVGWRYIAAMERLGRRGAWTAEDTWTPLPDADVTALAEAVGVLPDPASRTPVYQTRWCPELWNDEVGCLQPGGHRCGQREVPVHSTHRCVCGSLVIDGSGDEFLEPQPTRREEEIPVQTIGQLHDQIPLGGYAPVGRGWVVHHPVNCPCGCKPEPKPATPDYTDTTLVPYGFASVHRGCLAARKAAATDHVCDSCGRAFVPSTARWQS